MVPQSCFKAVPLADCLIKLGSEGGKAADQAVQESWRHQSKADGERGDEWPGLLVALVAESLGLHPSWYG